MAEHSFQEVMRQLNRMCKAHPKCEGEGNDCPLHEMGCCGNIGTYCSEPLQVERIKKTVVQWAAENPEPVYPTWREWLIKKGLIDFKADFRSLSYNPSLLLQENPIIECLNVKASEPIPADIAKSLGLEPKEAR